MHPLEVGTLWARTWMRSIRRLHQTGVTGGVAGHETMFICRNPQETPNTITSYMYMRRNEVPANYLSNDGKPEGLQVCIRIEAMSDMTEGGGGGGGVIYCNHNSAIHSVWSGRSPKRVPCNTRGSVNACRV